jgi:hypothetical protein
MCKLYSITRGRGVFSLSFSYSFISPPTSKKQAFIIPSLMLSPLYTSVGDSYTNCYREALDKENKVNKKNG